MEFGIFSQMHVPPWDDEHSRYLRELEVSLAVESAGFKYDWSPEHHFLTNYSHQPAPEAGQCRRGNDDESPCST